MTFNITEMTPVLPEIVVLSMTCLVLLVGLFSHEKNPRLVYGLAQLTLIIAAILTAPWFDQPTQFVMSGTFVLDKLAILAKLAIYGIGFFAFLYSRSYIKNHGIAQNEYYVLGLFAILGMMVMTSAHNFITLFLGVELLSLPLYALVAMRLGVGDAAEGAMKYFVMGAIASAMLLYGLSMLYGATKSLDLAVVAQVLNTMPQDQKLLVIFGLVFVVAGIVFKFGAAPFHMWAPDVYQGAANTVVLLISSAPKIAVLVLAYRLLAEAMPALQMQWQQLLLAISILSMGLGNIVAVVQTNLKRLLAYSAIAHMGYMLLGLLVATPQGYAASLFYIVTYTIMSVGAFAILAIMSSVGFEAEQIEDLRGLNQRSPWLAFMMLLIMFSLAGVPPSVGFFAKLGVLEVLVAADKMWLLVLALGFAVIGAYYYLRVIKTMYFDEPEITTPVVSTMSLRIAISVNGLAVLGLGIFPGALMQVCKTVMLH